MAEMRAQGTVRGSKVLGAPGKPPRPRPELAEPEDVADPRAPRRVVDYSLQRRQALGKLVLTATGASENLDPHPDLLRAAKYHGVPLAEKCPWCAGAGMVLLRYVWGDELGDYAGRQHSAAEIDEMAVEHGQFRVDEVEVCGECHWHFRRRSYVLGDGVPRAARRARKSDTV
ncbi:MAG: DUF5318 family protein [Actinobacteria bacterium]|nr:DUF5318 family protein [Actinomycetota bacterium]MCB8997036.1 DUF5318 family protein [Actinomycetota bacterium]MCB9425224.1 DUF5318 family protein [Actinomycetota bacterium]